MATTTLVGDVVRQVGGNRVRLTVLLPPGVDPHGFEPTPQDVVAVAEAEVVFVNGLGLERFLDSLLANAGGRAEVVSVSEGIDALKGIEAGAEQRPPEDAGIDPHVWFDPRNVARWAENVAAALGELDPDGAATYSERAQAYQAQLDALDEWIRQQVSVIPPSRRRLVVDHRVLGYFCRRYGFQQVATVVPGPSTLAEPSAAELARIVDHIRELDVPAVFVGMTVDPRLAERVAADTGARLVRIYTGSLSPPEGPAPSYLDFMRYNVSAIVGALKLGGERFASWRSRVDRKP